MFAVNAIREEMVDDFLIIKSGSTLSIFAGALPRMRYHTPLSSFNFGCSKRNVNFCSFVFPSTRAPIFSTLFGRSILGYFDRAASRIPFAGNVYKAIKQIIETNVEKFKKRNKIISP